MCGVLILIRGDHGRAGEVGHALCSAHLSGLQLVTHNTVTDDTVAAEQARQTRQLPDQYLAD